MLVFENSRAKVNSMDILHYINLLSAKGVIHFALKKHLSLKKLRTRPLVNGVKTKGCQRNKRWALSINYEVEGDL